MIIRCCSIAVLALWSMLANAAAPASTATASAVTNPIATNPAATSNPFGLVAGLVFLLALILIAAWLVKRTGGVQPWRAGASMKVVAMLSVGPRERVVLIELAGQQWLLGVAPGSVNTLHHFEQPIAPPGNAEDFSSKLRQFWPLGFGK